jgi:hypothetical protein
MEIDLDNVEEVDVTKETTKKRKREKIFKTDILDDDEKKKGTPYYLRNVEKIHKSKHTIWILKS